MHAREAAREQGVEGGEAVRPKAARASVETVAMRSACDSRSTAAVSVGGGARGIAERLGAEPQGVEGKDGDQRQNDQRRRKGEALRARQKSTLS